ncbi:DUF6059 family protein [Streptomyces sp. NPDC006997]|uniref:DUF6059 family protein n=1 Tax=Streptomyces sp. NPDC006997 TaxID=3155356 RepID=UPI0033E0849D
MKRLWWGGRRALAACCRPLWRSLALFGSLYCEPRVLQELSGLLPGPSAAADGDPWARLAAGGPPPAHPERLCPDLPLTPAERLLARDLWPPKSTKAATRQR